MGAGRAKDGVDGLLAGIIGGILDGTVNLVVIGRAILCHDGDGIAGSQFAQ